MNAPLVVGCEGKKIEACADDIKNIGSATNMTNQQCLETISYGAFI